MTRSIRLSIRYLLLTPWQFSIKIWILILKRSLIFLKFEFLRVSTTCVNLLFVTILKVVAFCLMFWRIFIWLIICRTFLTYFEYSAIAFKWYIFFVNWSNKFLYKCVILSFSIKRKKLIVDVNRVRNFSNVFDLFLIFHREIEKKKLLKQRFVLVLFFFFEHVI